MDLSLHLTLSWVILIFSAVFLIGMPFVCGFVYRANFKNYIVGMAGAVLVHLCTTKLTDLRFKVESLNSIYESSRFIYMMVIYLLAAAVFALVMWGGVRFMDEKRFGYRQAFTIGSGFAATYGFLYYGLQYRSNANTLSVYLNGKESEMGLEGEKLEAFRQQVEQTFSGSPYLMLLDLAAIVYMALILIAITLLICNGVGCRDTRMTLIGAGVFLSVNYLFEIVATFSPFVVLLLGVILAVASFFIIRDQSEYEIYKKQ